jgi:hypothetical protein
MRLKSREITHNHVNYFTFHGIRHASKRFGGVTTASAAGVPIRPHSLGKYAMYGGRRRTRNCFFRV